MDLLTTILACSLYAQGDDLVRAMAEGPAQGNPYRVVDVAATRIPLELAPESKTGPEAIARAHEILAQGGRPLLGLLELPAEWLALFGRDLASAFDPCTNIALGTAMLTGFDEACAEKGALSGKGVRRGPSSGRQQCVLAAYESAIGSPDFALAVRFELKTERAAAPALEEAPIFPPPLAVSWGPAQLLVPISGSRPLPP